MIREQAEALVEALRITEEAAKVGRHNQTVWAEMLPSQVLPPIRTTRVRYESLGTGEIVTRGAVCGFVGCFAGWALRAIGDYTHPFQVNLIDQAKACFVSPAESPPPWGHWRDFVKDRFGLSSSEVILLTESDNTLGNLRNLVKTFLREYGFHDLAEEMDRV